MGKLISAVIITKNEEVMLPACLKSMSFVDEIIVVDTGSTDKTVKIAKQAHARVVEYTSGKSFSDWRNRGLREVKNDWILYIDADERISPQLKDEILEKVNADSDIMWYAIPRSNRIWGHEFRHGGFWPDYVKRLYKRNSLKRWSGDLHEEPVVEGTMGKLRNPITHIKHETLSEMVDKTNKWSAIEGRLMFEANHPPMNIPRFITAMWREFWYRMVRHAAFLDGKRGIMMAMYQVFSRFVSYTKLWELQVNSKK